MGGWAEGEVEGPGEGAAFEVEFQAEGSELLLSPVERHDKNMWSDRIRPEPVCGCAFLFLYVAFLLTLLPPLTVLLMHLMPIPLLVLCYHRWKELREQGLVTFMPDKVQEVLLHSSLLDLLMAVWDLPNLVEYLKRLIYPFFVRMDKAEALMLFQELNPEVAAMMNTKGLVHMLPAPVKQAIAPEALFKDCLFLQPAVHHRPRHRSHASADLSKDPLPGPVRPRLSPAFKSELKTEVISSSSDIVSPALKGPDNITSVIDRLRHKVLST